MTQSRGSQSLPPEPGLRLTRRRAQPIVVATFLLVLAACESTGQSSPAPAGSTTAPPAQPTPASTDAGLDPASSAAAEGLPWDVPELVDAVEPQVVAVQTDRGEGSGVVFDADGIIVTNHHVIDGATEVAVVFASGDREQAEVVASDPRSDLAVLRVQRDSLPAATFSDEIPETGALALAMGNPLGFEGSVTLGIVSGVHRAVPGSPILVDLIQTDAPISPGNSGGALFGADGRVIGITVAYIPPGAGAVSIGFAIPSPTVVDVVGQLLEDGAVAHPYLGAQLATITPAIEAEFDLGVEHGALIVRVAPGSPAAHANLQPGDVIIRFGDQPIHEVGHLLVALRQREPGDRVQVEIVREGETTTVQVTLGEAPST